MMGKAAYNLDSVGLSKPILVLADGVDQDVADCDFARLGTVPRGYRNGVSVTQVFPLDGTFGPIENQVVPYALFVPLFLLLLSLSSELCGVKPPWVILFEPVIGFGPDLIAI